MPRTQNAFAFLIYDEHLRRNDISVATFLNNTVLKAELPYICSPLHDKDVTHYMSGDKPEKPHYHVLVTAPANATNKKAISSSIALAYPNEVETLIPKHYEDINDVYDYFLYLRHENLTAICEGKADYKDFEYPAYSEDFVPPVSRNKLSMALKYAKGILIRWIAMGEYEHSYTEWIDAIASACPQIVQWGCLTTFKKAFSDIYINEVTSAYRHLNNAFRDEKFENKSYKANAEVSAQETPISQLDAQKIGWKTEIINYVE